MTHDHLVKEVTQRRPVLLLGRRAARVLVKVEAHHHGGDPGQLDSLPFRPTQELPDRRPVGPPRVRIADFGKEEFFSREDRAGSRRGDERWQDIPAREWSFGVVVNHFSPFLARSVSCGVLDLGTNAPPLTLWARLGRRYSVANNVFYVLQ